MKKGWVMKKLSDIVTKASSNISQNQLMNEDGDYPIYGAGGLIRNVNFYHQNKEYISIVKDGAGIGRIATLPAYSSVIGTLQYLIPKEVIDTKFLYYILSNVDFNKYRNGSTIPHIYFKDYSEEQVPTPPLPEQQRIVSVLDEAFASIAQADFKAEQNLVNARELFESYLHETFAHKGDGWEVKNFDEICILQRGFDLPKQARTKGIYPLVTSNGITDRIDAWKVKAPGVATGRSGTIGNVHYIEENYWPLNTALYIKDFHGNYEKFVYYFLKQFNLGKYSSGAGVPTLNRNNVHSVKVWFPNSLAEQRAIVGRLEALSTETGRLEEIYKSKIASLEELKKSILQKAFAGEIG